jgi:hypothetical protein
VSSDISFEVHRIARVSEKIIDKTIDQWNLELPKSEFQDTPTTYEEVAIRLVELINRGNWKYSPYIKQELTISHLSNGQALGISGNGLTRATVEEN